MPELDDSVLGAGQGGHSAAGGTPPIPRVPGTSRPSRRTMLKGAAGVGAAGLAASVLASAALPATAVTKAQVRGNRGASSDNDNSGGEAIVVHVRDAASGEIDVFRGTAQIRLRDRDLAARLVRVSRT